MAMLIGHCRKIVPRCHISCLVAPTSTGNIHNIGVQDRGGIRSWEDDYSDLHVNWFPGHMVKATKIIREKLKHVDMVFEVRDARVPFSSVNADLDRIIGRNKTRLIILNKADLANPRLQQPVLRRLKAEGKTAMFACGRTGENLNKILAWAKEQGAKRGEFTTAGSVAMVVGMPNVGKSSLINLLRAKALRLRGSSRETAEKVARVGPTPGVTRQVSAFCIETNPRLFIVDTPGIMVPRVDSVSVGLRLALIRAVPDTAVAPDILVEFMFRLVRAKTLQQRQHARAKTMSGSSGKARQSDCFEGYSSVRAIDAWLQSILNGDHATLPGMASREHADLGEKSGRRGMEQLYACHEDRSWENEMEKLLRAVERESGAEGKSELDVKRRLCCQFVLEAFREGDFGRLTLDSVSPSDVPSVQSSAVPRIIPGEGQGGKVRPPGENEKYDASASRLIRDWSKASAWEGAEGIS